MKTLTIQSIKAQSHPETKGLFWHLFVGTRGGQNRVRIISQLRNKPSNKHQLSKDLELDYKGVEHHINTLEKNNLITKLGGKIWVESKHNVYTIFYFTLPKVQQKSFFEEYGKRYVDRYKIKKEKKKYKSN